MWSWRPTNACEPSQRAVVHPALVNGVTMSQVECVSVGAPAIATTGFQTVSYTPPSALVPGSMVNGGSVVNEAPVSYMTPHVVPAADTAPAPRRAARVHVRDSRRQPTRSVQKSALIIGGSAGAGGGLGAAIGGKKGALVGAILGGGGATLWDQITRRR